jgi:predicted dehydrogenase
VQVTRWRAPGAASGLRVQVVAERGQADLESPRRLAWTEAGGRHVLRLPRGRPPAELLLEQFHEAVASGQAPRAGIAEAFAALRWLRAAARSRDQGRKAAL